ncbi:hypothetical protein B566_EDAN010370 [Ephemera danica]|nr:hypothetical protein B566_EDAN010370 [Ephemera danica]
MVSEGRSSRRITSSASSTGSSTPSTPQQRRSVAASIVDPLGAALDGGDPLSQFAKEEMDPLSKMAAERSPWDNERRTLLDASDDEKLTQESWAARKSAILSRFTTSEKLSIVTSFLSGGDKVVARPQPTGPQTSAAVEKVRNRLEQLDDFEEGTVREEGDLSQGEYAARIEQLNTELLVHERLRSIAEGSPGSGGRGGKLPANFTPDMVPEAAKETCRNWFYKIASIRELVPRFYVETAILRSYSFLSSSEYSQALLRLTKMIRGIGDPLVAIFARCYLSRVGLSITRDRSYVQENLRGVRSELARQQVDVGSYLTLYTPALDWILQVAAHPGTEQQLLQLLARCQELGVKSGLVLNSIMVAFKAIHIAARASEFVDLINTCDNDGFPQYVLFRTLGLCVVAAEPPREQHLPLLNAVWKVVSRLTDVSHYASCAEPREVNTFLADMIKHLSPERAYEQHYPQLQSVVATLLRHSSDVETLFAMEKFLPFLDMFQKECVRVEVCKSIMEEFCKQHREFIHDPVTISGIMFLCRVLHDSVSALTVEDEKRQIGNLICGFVKAVDFGRDFEQQLSFYVDARAAFTNLDAVHVQLVQSVNRLSVDTRRIVGGHHTRKTAAFVRACAAYCFITVPSIGSVLSRLELYMLSGQVALLNQCLGQADACFKAALSLISEFPRTLEIDGKQRNSEPFLVSYICNFMSTLLVVPDPPEHGVLYLTRGLLNVIQQYPWENNNASKMTLYLNVLVDSNDALYGSDPKFVAEVDRMCGVIVEEILIHLKSLETNDTLDKQANISLELFQRLVSLCDLSHASTANLAIKLWQLSHRRGRCDPRMAARTLEQLKRRASGPDGKIYSEFLSHLQAKSTS